jgi:hypothetical protein
VGYFAQSPGGANQSLFIHWDGTTWSTVPGPSLGIYNEMNGIAARAANDIWAVGDGGSLGLQTLVMHWDGSQWMVIPSPNVGVEYDVLFDVAVVDTADAWAVGYTAYNRPGGYYYDTLVERYNSPCASATPTGTPTLNPPTATPPAATVSTTPTGSPATSSATPTSSVPTPTLAASTATPPTVTVTPPHGATYTPTAPSATPFGGSATPTATACAITFGDVDPSNPFYPFIRCLACRQIVSGYADGTFRWGNPVTRGQLAKIIAGAAGLGNTIPSTQQTFSDVPSTNPFWLFVERLVATGAISGYTCGGPGEPCDPQLRPYFRWTANATRGQIAKITAEAAQFSDPVPSTQQTFTDVPATNVFWVFIERLAARTIISGYTCGAPGEPCDPQNRPYFRWGQVTTRGQMSKIAANTFFPNCQTRRSASAPRAMWYNADR